MKEKSVNIKKAVISVLAVILSLFGIYNGVWLFYRQFYFVRIAEREDFTILKDEEDTHYHNETLLEDGTVAYYEITCPRYLSFSQGYTAFEEPEQDRINKDGKWIHSNAYRITLTVRPSLFGNPRYQIQIYDQKSANEKYISNETEELTCGNIYTFDVDSNMNITQEWSYGGKEIWENAHDEAFAIFSRAKDVFGL